MPIKTMINAMASEGGIACPRRRSQGAGTNELSPLRCTTYAIPAIVREMALRCRCVSPALSILLRRLDGETVDRPARGSFPRPYVHGREPLDSLEIVI